MLNTFVMEVVGFGTAAHGTECMGASMSGTSSHVSCAICLNSSIEVSIMVAKRRKQHHRFPQ